MDKIIELTANLRSKVGTGQARENRRNDLVPCIIYGEMKDPISINIEDKVIKKEAQQPGFFSKQYDIIIENEKHRVLAKDIQLHPVKENIIHVDFLRVGENTKVTVAVPVKFINDNLCNGLRQGGVINVVRREVELIAPVNSIPSFLEANLDGLEIGDSIHISSIKLNSNIRTVIKGRDFTIATIAPPTVTQVDEAVEETATQETDAKTSEEQDKKVEEKKEESAEKK
tara:strand:- start:1122 stop:1805 length:684 start_codon:yes stop_codon:yes gene_type:complete